MNVADLAAGGMNNINADKNGDAQPRILFVDDDESIRELFKDILETNQFVVSTAANVPEALHLIDTDSFDVLLSDLHMPGAGDGFTVISAMRHKHPNAITFLFTGFPALKQAMDAILLQADEILVKPMPVEKLIALIRHRLANRGTRSPSKKEPVASILEREVDITIEEWQTRVERVDELVCVPLSRSQRTGHLPQLIRELVHRLRVPRVLGTKQASQGAVNHGRVRRAQGYSIPMIIEESRILQVSIFHVLQSNLNAVNFSTLLVEVMAIADEIDLQLKETIISFTESVGGNPGRFCALEPPEIAAYIEGGA